MESIFVNYYLADRYNINFLMPLFAAKKLHKNRRKAKFVGSPLVVGKTDAFALLLREKVSVS